MLMVDNAANRWYRLGVIGVRQIEQTEEGFYLSIDFGNNFAEAFRCFARASAAGAALIPLALQELLEERGVKPQPTPEAYLRIIRKAQRMGCSRGDGKFAPRDFTVTWRGLANELCIEYVSCFNTKVRFVFCCHPDWKEVSVQFAGGQESVDSRSGYGLGLTQS